MLILKIDHPISVRRPIGLREVGATTELLLRKFAFPGRGADDINIGVAAVVIDHATIGAVIETDSASAVVGQRNGAQRITAKLCVSGGLKIKHAAKAAISFLRRANFLHRLHQVIVPAPQIGDDFVMVGRAAVWCARRFAGRRNRYI